MQQCALGDSDDMSPEQILAKIAIHEPNTLTPGPLGTLREAANG
jgi:hypothetical protein